MDHSSARTRAAEALVPTMAQCDANPADALIPIELKFKDTLHVAEFEVSWENPSADNVHIYFFDEIGELIAESASEEMPERVSLGSLGERSVLPLRTELQRPEHGIRRRCRCAPVRLLLAGARRLPHSSAPAHDGSGQHASTASGRHRSERAADHRRGGCDTWTRRSLLGPWTRQRRGQPASGARGGRTECRAVGLHRAHRRHRGGWCGTGRAADPPGHERIRSVFHARS